MIRGMTKAMRAPPCVATFVLTSPREKKSPPATPSATATPSVLRPSVTTSTAAAAGGGGAGGGGGGGGGGSHTRIAAVEPVPPCPLPPSNDTASAAKPKTESRTPRRSRADRRRPAKREDTYARAPTPPAATLCARASDASLSAAT